MVLITQTSGTQTWTQTRDNHHQAVKTQQQRGAQGRKFKDGFGNTYFAEQTWELELSDPPGLPGFTQEQAISGLQQVSPTTHPS